MPKEYLGCVASYTKKGMPRKKAQGICAGMFFKRHGITVQQAKARGMEGFEMEEVVLRELDTYAKRRELVSQAVRDRYGYPSDEVGAPYRGPYIVDVGDDVAVVEWEGLLFGIEFTIVDTTVELGEVQELERAYISAELLQDARELVTESWLPAGVTQTQLDDGDFAWLSFAYQRAGSEQREKMNKRKHRKLPYKVHGKVHREGWKAAWRAIAWTTYLRPSLAGGPSRSAVMAKLRRAKPRGIKLNKDDTYTDKSKASEGAGWRTALRATLFHTEPVVVEETDEDGEKPFTVTGVALIDGAVSQNGRYYSKEFNDTAMNATNKFMAEGGVVTVFARHSHALPKPPLGMAEGLPVGKVVKPLWRKGDKIMYQVIIVETSRGRDVQELIRQDVMPGTSIRSAKRFKSRMQKMDGRVVEVMEWAIIEGIDLTDDPGIAGAGITAFLEEAPDLVSISTVEEGDMDIATLTLEELQEERPDLVEELVGPFQARLTELEAEPVVDPETEEEETPTAEETPAEPEDEGQLAVLAGRIEELELALAIAQAAQQPVGKAIVEELTKVVKSPEDIEKHLPAIRTQAITAMLEAVMPRSEPSGGTTAKGRSVVEGSPKPDMTPQQKEIVGLAGGHAS